MTSPARRSAALYLTYDGLTSQIGQSQVMPYILGLASRGHDIQVVSFERRADMDVLGAAVAAQLDKAGVRWTPRRFRTRPPIFAKAMDQLDAARTCTRLVKTGEYAAIHCRSYVAADVGLRMKRRHGLRFVFDMRGFWVDQRLEGGRWPQSNPVYRALYRLWKRKERAFVAEADEIITLTHVGKDEIAAWPAYRGTPTSVIPCSLDYDMFEMPGPDDGASARRQLGIAPQAFVLAYLGSLGTVYLLREMFALFGELVAIRPDARFLFIGRHDKAQLLREARLAMPDLCEDHLLCVRAAHSDVPFWLGAADAGICFITPTFSSLGVSPTKLGEYLAVGLPVICNDRVGDVKEIVEGLNAGVVVDAFTRATLRTAAETILGMKHGNRRVRDAARSIFGIEIALKQLDQIYKRALAPCA